MAELQAEIVQLDQLLKTQQGTITRSGFHSIQERRKAIQTEIVELSRLSDQLSISAAAVLPSSLPLLYLCYILFVVYIL
jgi:hypothetical protein